MCLCLSLLMGRELEMPSCSEGCFPQWGFVFADSPTQETCRLGDGVSSLDTFLVGYRAPREPDSRFIKMFLGGEKTVDDKDWQKEYLKMKLLPCAIFLGGFLLDNCCP